MQLAAEDVLIAIEVSLIENLSTVTIDSVIDNIENKVKEVIPYASHSKIYVELGQENNYTPVITIWIRVYSHIFTSNRHFRWY
jgi:hypothetical protein